MTKQELIDAIHAHSGSSRADVERMLTAQASIVEGELSTTGEFIIPGIGKLNTAKRPARKGRNPQTGAVIEIPEKIAVTFKAVKSLKDAVQ